MRDFIPHPTLEKADCCVPESYVFAISGRNVLITERNGKPDIPLLHEVPDRLIDKANGVVLGKIKGVECAGFVCRGEGDGSFKCIEIRTAFTFLSTGACYALCRAKSLLEWKRRRNFCGACAEPLAPSETDIALKCSACGEAFYPQLSPAVIVAVTKGNKILLAHNYRFKERVHSLIAGFVEAGESIEQAIAREIFEETGISVCDIRYVSSQSWPFPNSLMLGFTAKYASGILNVDGTELECADWYSPEQLPQLPEKGSIARMIIDDFCSEKKYFG